MDDEGILKESYEYWEGHWLNPVAFAEKWYEDHPESFKSYSEALGGQRGSRKKEDQ